MIKSKASATNLKKAEEASAKPPVGESQIKEEVKEKLNGHTNENGVNNEESNVNINKNETGEVKKQSEAGDGGNIEIVDTNGPTQTVNGDREQSEC